MSAPAPELQVRRKAPGRQGKGPGRNARLARERQVLESFVKVYCRSHHGLTGSLCPDCDDLLQYALRKLAHCPYDPKPKCKKCPTHCYKPEYRQKIREVMKFSGIYFVKRGRLDWLVRYFMV